MSIKLQDDFNLHSRVAQRVFRILFVALGRKKIVHYWAKRLLLRKPFRAKEIIST